MFDSGEFRYERQWRTFRFWIVGWAVTGLVLLLTNLLLFYDGSNKDLWVVVVLILWLLFIITNARIMFWKCPKCNELFFAWWKRINVMSRYQCRNCGLEQYDGSSYMRKN
jgi:hypothetical protein